jgi:protein O-GlcNAc transferase
MPRPPNIPKRKLSNPVKISPQTNQVAVLIVQGLALHQQGKFNEALAIYEHILAIQENHFDTLQLLGALFVQTQQFAKAVDFLTRALKINPNYAACYSNRGIALEKLNRLDEALESYDIAIRIKSDYAEAHSNRSNILRELNRLDEALESCDIAIRVRPDYADAYSNRGNILNELNRLEEALESYDIAIRIKPDYADAFSNRSNPLRQLNRLDEALESCDIAIRIKPDCATAYSNRGNILKELNRLDEALESCDIAIRLKPDYADAYSNRGVTLMELNRFDEALESYNIAIRLKPDYAVAYSNRGTILREINRYDEAITDFNKALSLEPNIDWVYGFLIDLRMKICSWSDLESSLGNISKKIVENEKVIQPFSLLSLNDDSLLHKKSSEIYVQSKHPSNNTLGPISKRAKKDKIRIAYFSADFKNHPVALLTAELFELHDRDRFEVFAFSLQKATVGDEMNLRLRKSFDEFIDVDNMSDQEIAQLARKLEIDIAIDLSGLTRFARTRIFSYRVAPIQVNWLGYPGTIGADFIDYIVADKTIISEAHQDFYTEKVVYLPDTYMVDDSKRVTSSREFTREECGLRSSTFVFCCFNNDYKFNPQVLDRWSRILLSVDRSVLWVSENNKYFRTNIKTEFEKRGIDFSRIIFAQRLELMEDHLARYALADLFLDTHPYNAHTTAVDSLKAGVPVLTLMGQSFASRVAASLLNAIGLSELITNTQEEYEALAIELATNPKKLADIKLKLANNYRTMPLFNTPLFAKNIETAYIKMYEGYFEGLPPKTIDIGL